MESIWKKNLKLEEHNSHIDFNIYDAIVVGGGLTGLLQAHNLQRKGKAIVLVERESIGCGAIGDSMSMVTGQHGLIYADLLKKHGLKYARLYANANQKAIDEYERIIKSENIECHFERCPSYIYSISDEDAMKREAEACQVIGLDAHFTKDTELPFEVAGAVRLENQAKFNPMEFINAISKGLDIYENVRVRNVDDGYMNTNCGIVAAKNIIFATNNKFSHWRMMPIRGINPEERSVVALTGCEPLKGMYYGVDPGGLAIRSAGDTLLIGEAEKLRPQKRKEKIDYLQYLRDCAGQYFPQGTETTYWTSTDYYTKGRLPYIGRFSGDYKAWLLAFGFGIGGMTLSMVSVMINNDILFNIGNPYEKIFSREKILD